MGQGNSIASSTDNAQGGLNRTTSFAVPADAVGKDNAAYAVRKPEAGQWHNYCYHTKVPANATEPFNLRVHGDAPHVPPGRVGAEPLCPCLTAISTDGA